MPLLAAIDRYCGLACESSPVVGAVWSAILNPDRAAIGFLSDDSSRA